MNELLIKLFSKVNFRAVGERTAHFEWVSSLNLELASMGYAIDTSLMEAFSKLNDSEFHEQRKALIASLTTISGIGDNHARLFNKFPYEMPEQRAYMVKMVISFIANMNGMLRNECTVLECGHAIDTDMLPLEDFGACPVCQFQVSDLTSPSGARYAYADLTPLKVLGYASDSDMGVLASAIMNRQSSISSDEKAFVLSQKNNFFFDRPTAIFRENIPLLYEVHGRIAARQHVTTATDVLRIATHLSSPDADLSLKDNVKFKIKTSDKRALLSFLDALPNLTEDMMRNRERWLRLGERLNPNSEKNRLAYPKAALAFDQLRNSPKAIVTFNRTVEKTMRGSPERGQEFDLVFLEMLALRPGEFARRLDFLLRTNSMNAVLVNGVFANKVVQHLPTEMLIRLFKYFQSRDMLESRIFMPKGAENKMKVLEDRRKPIMKNHKIVLLHTINKELYARLSVLAPLGKIFIDPALEKVLLPYNKRGDSSTTSAIPKGSQIPFEGDVVRLFVHWTGDIDVDLSCALYDDRFNSHGFIGFQNLKSDGAYHSGDVLTAPHGASEFIDFEVETLIKRGVRYVASSIILYSGRGLSSFDKFPCYAGFMQRDSLKSGEVYEPASVAMKFDVNSNTTSAQPFIFDLKERMVIFADLSGGKQQYGSMAGEIDKHRAVTESVLSLPLRKPTVYDVVFANVMARGEMTIRENATKIYDLSNIAEAIADFMP